MDAVTIAGLAGLTAVAWKLTDWVRLLVRARENRSAIATQGLAFLVAIVVVFVYAQSDLADFVIPGTEVQLHDANVWTLGLFGVSIGAAAGVGVDLKRALDRSDSAAQPQLLRDDG